MNIYQNSDNYLRMTNAARAKQGELEKAGYLFSHYERFKEVSDYDKIIYQSRLKQVAEQLIDAQEQREEKFYQALSLRRSASILYTEALCPKSLRECTFRLSAALFQKLLPMRV